MLSLSLSLSVVLATLAIAQDCTTCESFGVDFVDGGSYFQNIASTDPFTAYEQFEGCQDDTADNILVDPSGNQYECNSSNMTPSDTNQLVTCSIDKNQLVSGNYSIVVLSNNGNCAPIDYKRDFYLTVGLQQTSTVGPTVTITSTFTPVSSTTVISTTIVTVSANPVTKTVTGVTATSTYTTTPAPFYVVTTKGVATITVTSTVANVVGVTTVTTTAPCTTTSAPAKDVVNTNIVITMENLASRMAESVADEFTDEASKVFNLFPVPTGTVFGRSGSTEAKRAALNKEAVETVVEVRTAIRQRAIQKRHPDAATTTVTNTNGVTSTSTSVVTTSTLHVTGTSTVVQTTSVTPTVTVTSGQSTVATVTAPTPTTTLYFYVPVETDSTTVTTGLTATYTSTVTPAC